MTDLKRWHSTCDVKHTGTTIRGGNMKSYFGFVLVFLCFFPLSYSFSHSCDHDKGQSNSSSNSGPAGGGGDAATNAYVSCVQSQCPGSNSQCLATCARGTASEAGIQPGADPLGNQGAQLIVEDSIKEPEPPPAQ